MAQFDKVGTMYGAPMGRHSWGIAPQLFDGRTVRLFRVNLDKGGYDDGGAYWGHGKPLWCAMADIGGEVVMRQFVRAGTRAEACLALEIDPATLKKPLQG